ncbi:MAG: hypothetical protein DLM57_07200 [Pseudonocardiales bacterium]|nr:MAG: hypothetical protein DLM57_07200 [Pseudonocardiales bacterium]
MIDVVCHYYEPRKVPLLRAAVLPAIAEVEASGGAAHVERHWLHGPHLRVRVTAAEPEAAADAVADRIRAYLRDHPSTVQVDVARMLREARRAGEAELVVGPYTPINADNTVYVEPSDHRRITALLGSPQAAYGRDALLRLGVAPVSATAAYLDAHGNRVESRVQVGVAAMAAHAANYPHGIGSGHQSFLSHLEDFLVHDDPDGAILAAFDRAWHSARAGTVSLLRSVTEGTSLPSDLDPVIDAWRDWSRAAWAHAEATMDTDTLTGVNTAHTTTAATFGGATELRWDFSRRRFSDYHTVLNTVGFEKIARSRMFGIYRFCTNMLYQLLLVCDLAPIERYLAAHLLVHAVEEIDGRTWRERLAAYAAAQAAVS